jgi:hypothetical protein
MNPDHEGGAGDQPDDPKKVAKRREQNRLAKKRSREKQKQDRVRNEGKSEEEKEQEGGDQFARIWGIVIRQKNFISELEMGIARRDGLLAGQEELISGLEFLNKGLNELCNSQSACIREVRDDLRESNERKSGSIQEPVQANHSELLASPRPSQVSPIGAKAPGLKRPSKVLKGFSCVWLEWQKSP